MPPRKLFVKLRRCLTPLASLSPSLLACSHERSIKNAFIIWHLKSFLPVGKRLTPQTSTTVHSPSLRHPFALPSHSLIQSKMPQRFKQRFLSLSISPTLSLSLSILKLVGCSANCICFLPKKFTTELRNMRKFSLQK